MYAQCLVVVILGDCMKYPLDDDTVAAFLIASAFDRDVRRDLMETYGGSTTYYCCFGIGVDSSDDFLDGTLQCPIEK